MKHRNLGASCFEFASLHVSDYRTQKARPTIDNIHTTSVPASFAPIAWIDSVRVAIPANRGTGHCETNLPLSLLLDLNGIPSKSPVIPHIPHSLPQTNSDIGPPCFLLLTHR